MYVAFRLALVRHPEREAIEELGKSLLCVVAVVEPVEKEEFWSIVGRARGVWYLFTGARHITTLAAAKARKEPDAASAAEEIICGFFMMRMLLPFVYVEAAICSMAPPFPRAMAGAFVRLFCDLVVTFQAADSIGSAV